MLCTSRRARASGTGALALVAVGIVWSGEGRAEPPTATTCTIAVTRLPAAALAGDGYELWIAGQGSFALPRAGRLRVDIAEPTHVTLRGPAYAGELELDPSDCGEGREQVLEARAKPAKLSFQAGAVSADELVVSCVRGCEHRLIPASRFPELPMPEGELELVVAFEFKARGYRSRVGEYKLHPGENQVSVSLAPISVESDWLGSATQ